MFKLELILGLIVGLMLMAGSVSAGTVTYSAANNKITVAGYTVGSPCGFNTLWTADKAGTLTLFSASVYDGDTNTTTTQVRPADDVSLKLDFTISDLVGTGNITVIGTDKDDGYQEEVLDVTANTIYQTTNWYKTITNFTTDGFNSTLGISQGQWGVVYKQSSTQFYLTCHFYFSTGYFKDTAKDIRIDAASSTYIHMGSTAHFQLGNKDANGNVYDGCKFEVLHSDGNIFGCGGAGVMLYDSYFNAHGSTRFSITTAGPHEIIGCIFENTNILRIYGDSTVKDVWMHRGTLYGFNPGASTEINNMIVSKRPYGIYALSGTVTFKNVVTRDLTSTDIYIYPTNTGVVNVIDSILASWTITWNGATATVYRQNSFDLKVIDKYQDAIDGAKVEIWDKDDNLVTDTTTYANGSISTATLNYGYYNVTGGDNAYMQTPHKIKISHQDYPTRQFQFNITEKTDWTIALKDRPDSEGYMTVFGTEYCESDLGEARAFIRYGNSTPADSATVSIKLWNGTWDTMTLVENGMYQFNFTAPAYSSGGKNVYFFYVNSTSPTAWGTGEFTVKDCDKLTSGQNMTIYDTKDNVDTVLSNQATLSSDISSTNSTIHTKMDSIITTLSTMVSDVWAHGTRTLTAINYNIYSNWNIMQDYVWNTTTRTITTADWTTDTDLIPLAHQDNLTDGIVVLTPATETQIDTIESNSNRILNATEVTRATINDASATTTQFDTTLTQTSDFWNRAAMIFTSGANKGQMRRIKDFTDGGVGAIKVHTPFDSAPADGDAFLILPVRAFLTPDIEDLADAVWNENQSDHTTDGSFGKSIYTINESNYWIERMI